MNDPSIIVNPDAESIGDSTVQNINTLVDETH